MLIVIGHDSSIYPASYALLRHETSRDIAHWLKAISTRMERAGTPWKPSCAFIDASTAEDAALRSVVRLDSAYMVTMLPRHSVICISFWCRDFSLSLPTCVCSFHMKIAVGKQLMGYLGGRRSDAYKRIMKGFTELRVRGFGLSRSETRKHVLKRVVDNALRAVESWLDEPDVPIKFKEYFMKQWTKTFTIGMAAPWGDHLSCLGL